MHDDVSERSVLLDRSVADTWTQIADAERLGAWLGGDFDGDLAEGERFVFRGPDGTQIGEIHEVAPLERVRWTWTDGSDRSDVTIEIDGDDRSTLVTVTERLAPRTGWSRPSIPPLEAAIA